MANTPGLMGLPPELRNMIYEPALTEPTKLDVTQHFTQPALLTVNRAIRAEARILWYTQTDFVISVHDYDARKVNRFTKYLRGARLGDNDIKIWFCLAGEPQWANLMRWCRAVRLGKSTFPEVNHGFDANDELAVAALEMSRAMGSVNKEERRIAWSGFRKATGLVDARWLEDK